MNDYQVFTFKVNDEISGRLATKLTQLAFSYSKNSIFIQKHVGDNRRVSAKSLLGVLSLGIRKGDTVNVLVSNDNESTILIGKQIVFLIGGAE